MEHPGATTASWSGSWPSRPGHKPMVAGSRRPPCLIDRQSPRVQSLRRALTSHRDQSAQVDRLPRISLIPLLAIDLDRTDEHESLDPGVGRLLRKAKRTESIGFSVRRISIAARLVHCMHAAGEMDDLTYAIERERPVRICTNASPTAHGTTSPIGSELPRTTGRKCLPVQPGNSQTARPTKPLAPVINSGAITQHPSCHPNVYPRLL